jgi:hypothetical protein
LIVAWKYTADQDKSGTERHRRQTAETHTKQLSKNQGRRQRAVAPKPDAVLVGCAANSGVVQIGPNPSFVSRQGATG